MFSRQLSKLIHIRYSGNVAEFSRNLGKRESVIRNWLKGAQPRLADVVRMARAERVSLAWLTEGIGPDPEPVAPGQFAIADRMRSVRGSFDAETFARLVGVSTETVRAVESGTLLPGADVLDRLADQVDLNWLVTGTRPPESGAAGSCAEPPIPMAERLLAHVIANEKREFSDRMRAAAAEEMHRLLRNRFQSDTEPDEGDSGAPEPVASDDTDD